MGAIDALVEAICLAPGAQGLSSGGDGLAAVVDAMDEAAVRGALLRVLGVAARLAESAGAEALSAAVEESRGSAAPSPADACAEGSVLDGIVGEAALERAWALQRAAASVGFDWPDRSGVRAKVDEELRELDDAINHGDAEAVEDELGDLLFSVVNLSRFLPARPDVALRRGNAKFERRFRQIEALCRAEGVDITTAGIEVLEAYWQRAKRVTSSG